MSVLESEIPEKSDATWSSEGMGIILISDEVEEIVANCNRVIVMKDGEIVGRMDGDEVQEENIVKIIS